MARNGYRTEEEEEMKRMGPILWSEVAGGERNRPEKGSVTVAGRGRSGLRREKWVSRNGNPKWKLPIYRNFYKQ